MIQVKKLFDDDVFVGVEVKGHAGQAPPGESVVCAAVSSITQFCDILFSRLEPAGARKIEDVEGYCLFIVYPDAENKDVNTGTAIFILDSLSFALIALAKQYPKFIQCGESKI